MRSIFADEPLQDLDASDELDYKRIAERLLSLLGEVRSGSAEASTVVGLVGSWGAGKTSVLNHVVKNLVGWEVRRVETWLASDAADLVTEVYASIASALPGEERWNNTRDRAKKIFRAATPLLSLLNSGAGELAKAMADRYDEKESVAEAHRRLADGLRALPEPILIVLDDVDRLQPDELRELLRAMRVVGRLPRISYLLAYDDRSLLDALRATSVASSDRRAREFLEKIVQVRIDLPRLMPGQARALLLKALGSGDSDGDRLAFSEEELARFDLRWDLVLRHLVTTPRHVRLLQSQIRATWGDVADEVDVVDFVTVTSLRLLEPALYLALEGHRDTLSGGGSLASILTGPQGPDELRKRDANLRQSIADQAREELREGAARWLIDTMFPAQKGSNARPRNGIGSPAYVDRYFYVGVPPDDVPDRVVKLAVADIVAGKLSEARTTVESALRVGGPASYRILGKLHAHTGTLDPAGAGALLRWVTTEPGVSALGRAAPGWVEVLLSREDLVPDTAAVAVREASDAGINAFLHSLMSFDPPTVKAPATDGGHAALDSLAVETRHRLAEHFSRHPEPEPVLAIRTAMTFLACCDAAAFETWILERFQDEPAWDALDLAARFVQRRSYDDGRTWIADQFDRSEFLGVLPDSIAEAAADIARTMDPSVQPTNSGDHSNLRTIAAAGLGSA